MVRITVALGDRAYDVHVGCGLIDEAGRIVTGRTEAGKAAIITDEGVPPFHVERVAISLARAGLEIIRIVVPSGDDSKTLQHVEQVCDRVVRAGIERRSLIVAVGGGMLMDLGGFCGAILFRGLPWLAQASDADGERQPSQ